MGLLDGILAVDGICKHDVVACGVAEGVLGVSHDQVGETRCHDGAIGEAFQGIGGSDFVISLLSWKMCSSEMLEPEKSS